MSRIIGAFKQFFDGNGDPLVDGWLRFLESGTNNTDKNTYADSGETIANTNPLQLDSEGRAPDIFGQGAYRVISYTNDLVDNIPAQQIQLKDPVSGAIGTADFTDYDSSFFYDEGDIVIYNSEYYRSLSFDNQGNTPAFGSAYWERIDFISYWNTSKEYSIGDSIRYLVDGIDYVSLTDSNTGNTPPSSTTEWSTRNVVLTDSTLTGDGTTGDPLEVTSPTSNKNYARNGSMQVSQRGDYTTPVAIVTGTFYLDMWTTYLAVITATLQDIGGAMEVKATSTATGAVGSSTAIEDFEKFIGETVTVSADVISNTPDASLSLYDTVGGHRVTKHSGSGLSERLSVTSTVYAGITGLYCGGYIFGVAGANIPITSGDYVSFGNMKLEFGPVDTGFVPETYEVERALCDAGSAVVTGWPTDNHIVTTRTMGKNYIINGLPEVSQRGDFATAPVSAVNGTYYLDRWKAYVDVVTATVQDTGGGQKYVATSTATGRFGGLQKVEDFSKFAGKQVTLSADVISNSTDARILFFDGSLVYSSIGHTGGGSSERLSVTATVWGGATTIDIYGMIGDSGSLAVSITSGDYIEFKNVKLEFGPVDTGFVPETEQEVKKACLPYAYVPDTSVAYSSIGHGYGATTTTVFVRVNLPNMRVVPSITVTPGEWVVSDGVNVITVTNLTLDTSTSSDRATLVATVASGITQFRPYELVCDSTPGRKMIFASEI